MQATETFRVLIVDDNEAIHRDFRTLLGSVDKNDDLAELALEVLGGEVEPGPPAPEIPRYAFDSAYQGRAALETVKQASSTGQSYALAFVDVRMPPGWDGVETIQRIWQVDPNIQMIICSAYSDYSWDEIVQEFGVTDKLLLLRKPFDPNSVKQMALSVACRWSRERQNRERATELEAMVGTLRREIDDMKAAASSDEQAREERRQRLAAELGGIITALEGLVTASPAEEQKLAATAGLRSARTLLDELSTT